MADFYGNVNAKGQIYGLAKAVEEFNSAKNVKEYKGKSIYKSESMMKLNLKLKTSESNTIFVEVLAFTPKKEIKLFSTNKDERGDTKTVPYADRYKYKKNGTTEGYEVFGVKLRSNEDEEVANLTTDDAIKYILNKFVDGDTVFMGLGINHSTRGDKVFTNLEIKRIFKSKEPINFEDENFEELCEFSEKFIFESAIKIEEDQTMVNGVVVDYRGEHNQIAFTIHEKDVADFFLETASRGDGVEVTGLLHNRVTYKNSSVQVAGGLVGKSAKSFSNNNVKEIESEQRYYEIQGVESLIQGAYLDVLDATPEAEEALPWE